MKRGDGCGYMLLIGITGLVWFAVGFAVGRFI